MVDALLNVAVFAVLALSIVAFGVYGSSRAP